MSELLHAYWPMILVAVAIGLMVGLIIFRRPKQRVTLSKTETPVRPHMAVTEERAVPAPVVPRGEGNGLADEFAAASSDVVGEVIRAPVHSHLPGSKGVPDNLQRMKGVGPKLASLLQERGLTRYEQIAALTPQEITDLDAHLGTFKGRLVRDRIVDQARYLARGDDAGYEREFGKL
jgi:predicted flap endonuclease-1-like 5' DNA nuclease